MSNLVRTRYVCDFLMFVLRMGIRMIPLLVGLIKHLSTSTVASTSSTTACFSSSIVRGSKKSFLGTVTRGSDRNQCLSKSTYISKSWRRHSSASTSIEGNNAIQLKDDIEKDVLNKVQNSSSIIKEQESNDQQEQPEDTTNERNQFYIYYNDVYEVNLPPKHRFPMYKYRKAREQAQRLIKEREEKEFYLKNKEIHCEFIQSPLATIEELATTHCMNYIQRYLIGDLTNKETRNTGFPWSLQHVNRSLSSVGGTIAAAERVCQHLVLKKQNDNKEGDVHSFTSTSSSNSSINMVWGAHVAGGTHHAFKDYGEGFCIFNDIAVATNVMLQKYPTVIKRVLILDLDVHQGNGSAVLFQNIPHVTTFSLHCNGNYFSTKQLSDIDIELPIGCNDGTYLQTLHYWLKQLLSVDKKYDLIFFQAGVDILSQDRLGKMNITMKGLHRRNEMVYKAIEKYSSQHNGTTGFVITMGGGYPKSKTDTTIIDAHAQVYVSAYDFLSSKQQQQHQQHV